MLVKFANKEQESKLVIQAETCQRCGKEGDLNPIGLCTSCNTEVDIEYSLMYTAKTMDY